jgi:hypothetical protein
MSIHRACCCGCAPPCTHCSGKTPSQIVVTLADFTLTSGCVCHQNIPGCPSAGSCFKVNSITSGPNGSYVATQSAVNRCLYTAQSIFTVNYTVFLGPTSTCSGGDPVFGTFNIVFKVAVLFQADKIIIGDGVGQSNPSGNGFQMYGEIQLTAPYDCLAERTADNIRTGPLLTSGCASWFYYVYGGTFTITPEC